MSHAAILESLPIEQRLALAYAPARTRRALLALLGLDQRLSQVVLTAREQMLGQLRLAWWRDRLGEERAARRGEPLLDLLDETVTERPSLVALVDAWEGLLCVAPHGESQAIEALADARAAGFTALLPDGGDRVAAVRMARAWALADLARLPSGAGQVAAVLATQADWQPARLPRDLRSLAVLHGLARQRCGDFAAPSRPSAILIALRVGLLGV
ncbi:MAG: hypothetical protein KGM18_02445 [Sphingomonadales bacterium]|nr:hypothetical protein [Sphingomonadales bacterium]